MDVLKTYAMTSSHDGTGPRVFGLEGRLAPLWDVRAVVRADGFKQDALRSLVRNFAVVNRQDEQMLCRLMIKIEAQ